MEHQRHLRLGHGQSRTNSATNGMDATCDQRARELLALIRLGQTTLRVISDGEDEWGGAIATAQQWREP